MFSPPPDTKINPDGLDDCPGEIRCMFDKDGNYKGPPSPWPIFFTVGVIVLIAVLIVCLGS